jgi:hypothetical protein
MGQLVSIKEQIKSFPVLGNWIRWIYSYARIARKPILFPGSSKYWERRYASGGNSGAGSYKLFAKFKAEILNDFVVKHDIRSVIELGCGDGNQLKLANYPQYIGFDISDTVIALCKNKFSSDTSKLFKAMREYNNELADLSLSLDVIFHLVEDEIYDKYMHILFNAATRYVIIYSSNYDNNAGFEGTHVRHREFTKWVQNNKSNWKLRDQIENKYPYTGNHNKGSFSDFFIYEKVLNNIS